MQNKSCCFIGHRDAIINKNLIEQLRLTIEKLICNDEVTDFIFGSNSVFSNVCHLIVTDLKENYPYINRIAYCSENEYFCLESEREQKEAQLSSVLKKEIRLFGFEKGYTPIIQSNVSKKLDDKIMAMIDDSDYCIFYCNEKELSSFANRYDLFHTTNKTAVAYEYAMSKNKEIINMVPFREIPTLRSE